MDKIKEFLEKIGIEYNDLSQYELPFLHSSYTHETPWDDESYERLEFLGDSILGMCVSEYLYKKFPDYSQGDMTLVKHYLVNKEFLSKVGKKLKIQDLMYLGAGEDRDNLSPSVFEDVIEALTGAIYLDKGLDVTVKFLMEHVMCHADELDVEDVKDSKTKLQELLQGETRKPVTYKTDNGERIDGVMHFNAHAMFSGNVIGEGSGLSKKEAEKDAAQDALDRMVK